MATTETARLAVLIDADNASASVVKELLEEVATTSVFTYRGEPVGQLSTRDWQAALQRAGIENFRWHDLRHTFATWHRQAGTPTHELQRLGGWRTGAMVERYAHIAPEALQGAASRLDSMFTAAVDPSESSQRPPNGDTLQ